MKKTFILMLAVMGLAQVASARSPIRHESFFLLRQPGVANPSCQVGTEMKIDYPDFMVNLVDVVHGGCEISVVPNERTYKFEGLAQKDGCGSYHWLGTRETSEGLARVDVTDNRRRTCRNQAPATIMVHETRPNGETRTLYSERDF